MSKLKLIFFGSGPVGLASLKALSEEFEIEAVVTKPNPTSSRAPRLVAEYAESQGLELHQPPNADELTKLFTENSFDSQVGVVVDYGFIIHQDVIDCFKFGIVNSHFSLLPEWRGADPITFSLLSGQDKTGVSLMVIVPAMDEGDLISQEELAIRPDETIESLTQSLIELSNRVLVRDLPRYLASELKPYPQSADIKPTYSRKLVKKDGKIDWSKSAAEIERDIRAYLGWPGSYTTIKGIDFTVTEAEVMIATGEVGTPFVADKKLGVYCGKDALLIERLKPSGKQEMDSQSFLNGYQIIDSD